MADSAVREDKDVPPPDTSDCRRVVPRRVRVVVLDTDPMLPHTLAVARQWLIASTLDQEELERWLAEGRVDILVVGPQALHLVQWLRERLVVLDPLLVSVDGAGVGLPGAVGSAWTTEHLATAISLACVHRSARIEREVLRQGGTPAGVWACREIDELVGGGEAMSGLRMRLRQVAEHDGPTLVCGPLGTPLDATARWLHVSSRRGSEAFLPVDCGGASTGLFESRLFGHEHGAFPGADCTHPGSAALADGGTILLRDLELASPTQQDRIADLVTSSRWQLEGGTTWRSADVRVIAMLEHDVLDTASRPRLDRRLLEAFSTRIVRVPPLAERLEDISEIVRHHLVRLAARYGCARTTVDDRTLDTLAEASWPGNDRELELACEQMLIQARAGRLEPPPGMVNGESAKGLVCDGTQRTLADLERDAIVATLHHHHGHRRRSAAALGIGVRTLGLKLRQWKDAHIVPDTL